MKKIFFLFYYQIVVILMQNCIIIEVFFHYQITIKLKLHMKIIAVEKNTYAILNKKNPCLNIEIKIKIKGHEKNSIIIIYRFI